MVPFNLTPRQRRLRTISAIVICFIAAMLFIGLTSPFFHPHIPAVITPHLRKAFAVRSLIILIYWFVCFILASSLILLAMLDLREVRKKLAMTRRDIWRDIADETHKSNKNS